MAVTDDWPKIDGIDRPHAMKAMEGNQTLFLRLLPLFVKEQGPMLEQIDKDLAAGHRAEAAHLLHNLQGGAAQIGALDVRRRAIDAERAIRAGSADVGMQMMALTRAFDRLVKGVEDMA